MPLTGDEGSDIVSALGRFHILALHFPIALLLITPLLELMGRLPSLQYLRQGVQPILWMAALFSAAACGLGFMLATGEGYVGKLIEAHMWGGIICTILMFVALFFNELNAQLKNGFAYVAYLIALIGSIGVMSASSHQGASMVHGEDYLYEKAPAYVKDMLGIKEVPEVILTYESPVYQSLIEPIFAEHCYSCHSDLKQKGQFRADTLELMAQGGKSSRAGITPSDLEHSEVYKRMVLPTTSQKLMPPIEEPQLSVEKIALVKWWIEGGASDRQTIEELTLESYPENIEAIISSLIQVEVEETPSLDLKTYSAISKAEKDKFGIDIILYSQNPDDGVYIVARNAANNLPDNTFEGIEPLAPHVLSMNLWRCNLSDKAYQDIAMFNRLKELHLNESNVSSKDLEALTSLRKLRTLNLFGTQVGDEAIGTLSKMRSLKKLHLYKSQFTDAGVAQLRDALPLCEILYTFEIPEVEPRENKYEETKELAAQ